MQSLTRRSFLSFTEKKPEPAGFWLHVNRSAMACRFEVTLPIDDRAGVAVATTALNLIDELESQLSVFRERSEISFINREAASRAVPVEESSDVFVVPRDGSFGFAQVTQRGPRAITIPEGTSRIVIRAESESHAPIAGLFAVMRYNGRVVPSDVVRALAAQGSRVSSGEDGRIILEHMPAGAYEFWPVESPMELDSLVTVLNAGTPVRMTVTAGENSAILTFARNAGL